MAEITSANQKTKTSDLQIMEKYKITDRNKVKRIPERGHYDKETLYNILDDGFLCHLGFTVDNQVFVIPTLYGRNGNTVYIHGATTSRLLKNLQKGIPVCLNVTHIDGLVLARSAFHHSMNYRSAVVFGSATTIPDDEKEAALRVISENMLQGRWNEVRKPNAKELRATTVLALEIQQASCKIRTGSPSDENPDYELNVWAGIVPMPTQYGTPVPDELLKDGIPLSRSVQHIL